MLREATYRYKTYGLKSSEKNAAATAQDFRQSVILGVMMITLVYILERM